MSDSPSIGTSFTENATRVMLCGSGELGKEVVIELQRYGVEVIACDSYPDAPAMQVADHAEVFSMLDGARLREVVEKHRPHFVVPEVEAIATDTLGEIEAEGLATVIPTARATRLTMNREGIRRLAAETLGLATSPYRFASTGEEYRAAVAEIGLPCVVKPIMSSSGKGQSTLRREADIEPAWTYAQEGGRAGKGKVIVEGFVDFDYEITLLTLRHAGGTSFLEPIGHTQEDGDYRESWQPQPMSEAALAEARRIALAVTDDVGGYGIFGVELFVKGDKVYFSEVSPRPHDTGMVTMISQDLSQFALHARAILGLPVPNIVQHGPSASAVLLVRGESESIGYGNLAAALSAPDTQLRLFGKKTVKGHRRMGVALARGKDITEAREKARNAAAAIRILGWASYACLTLPLKALLYESIGYALLVTVFRESFAFLATSAMRRIYLRLDLHTDRPALPTLIVFCLAFACSGLDTLISFGVEKLGGRTDHSDPVFGLFAFRALLFVVWSILYFTIKDLLASRERLRQLHEAEKAARDAEILMLRAQVSPHFLFNAFNTILAELDGRSPEVVPVVRGLSDYFRYSLSSHNDVLVTMGQEYDAICSYLTVEKARFGDSLEIHCQLDPRLREMKVPGIFLQPIIENALRYGYQTSPTPLVLRLEITATPEGGARVEVSNSGTWIEPSPPSHGQGTGGQGLSVLKRRLELLYHDAHCMEIIHTDKDDEAGDVASAAELCEELKPDLIFLDIQMPRLDGFALLPLLKKIPEIIFVTAFDKYAVRAFEVNAFDYLLKPIAPARLEKSILRLGAAPQHATENLEDTDVIALREDSQLRMVPLKTITHIEAEDNYTRVHIRGDAPAMVRRQMADWDELLPAPSFFRVSRSLIVRLDSIKKLHSLSRDLSQLTLHDHDRKLELGRTASLKLKKAIENQ
eukprot:g4073.t1